MLFFYRFSLLHLLDPFVMDEVDDHPSSRWAGRSPRSSDPTEPQLQGTQKKKKKRKRKDKAEEEETGRRDKKGKGRSRQPKQSSVDCRVEKREMKVRDLGLGFDSDEIVLFKFCVGSCQSSRTTYDLALKALLENGSLPRRKVSSHPCCRPDRYESVSFMDAQTTWRTIQSLSAASCMCMGWSLEPKKRWRAEVSPWSASTKRFIGSPGREMRPGGAVMYTEYRSWWRSLSHSRRTCPVEEKDGLGAAGRQRVEVSVEERSAGKHRLDSQWPHQKNKLFSTERVVTAVNSSPAWAHRRDSVCGHDCLIWCGRDNSQETQKRQFKDWRCVWILVEPKKTDVQQNIFSTDTTLWPTAPSMG